MEIDPRLLRNFLAVAEELNFNRAAQRLHLSQPSLSVAIRKLEAHWGFKLFERNVRKVELTDHGRRLVPIARDLIERNNAVGAFIQQLARGEPEVFRIAYSPFLDMTAIGAIRSGFKEVAPVPLEFVSAATSRQITGLLKGELLAGLLTPIPQEPAITVEILRRQPFVVAVPRGHRLEGCPKVSLDNIRFDPVIWFARELNSTFHDSFLAWCAEAGYAPKVVQTVTTSLECVQFVAQGVGISFVSPALASMGFDNVSFSELDEDTFYIETALAYRCDDRSAILQNFIHFVREWFRAHP